MWEIVSDGVSVVRETLSAIPRARMREILADSRRVPPRALASVGGGRFRPALGQGLQTPADSPYAVGAIILSPKPSFPAQHSA